jgi:3-oxoisoapionate kinase
MMGPMPPDGPVVAFYGDDFTGSAATMEALTFAGLQTVLFLEPPKPDDLARFRGARAIGIAGDARTRDPDWMDAHLPRVFAALRATGARVIHHKVCSTLDSAPHVGSVGRAAEIGLAGGGVAPMILAAPMIGRWQAFGNLFARSPEGVARLDRHPTMNVHPVTPMDEGDVRLHLARQTALSLGLVDLVALKSGEGSARYASEVVRGARIVALDVVDDETLERAGALVWAEASGAPVFVIGSQGVEYALIAHWRMQGLAEHMAPQAAAAKGPVAVVSGSCSPDTARQVAVAEAGGYAVIDADAGLARDPAQWAAELGRADGLARQALSRGQSALIATARGHGDPRVAAITAVQDRVTVNASIATGLGTLLAGLSATGLAARLGIAGGDTSSLATAALGAHALTAVAALAPSAPLLHLHFRDPELPPVELVLKGGQMGRDDFFLTLRDGA